MTINSSLSVGDFVSSPKSVSSPPVAGNRTCPAIRPSLQRVGRGARRAILAARYRQRERDREADRARRKTPGDRVWDDKFKSALVCACKGCGPWKGYRKAGAAAAVSCER